MKILSKAGYREICMVSLVYQFPDERYILPLIYLNMEIE